MTEKTSYTFDHLPAVVNVLEKIRKELAAIRGQNEVRLRLLKIRRLSVALHPDMWFVDDIASGRDSSEHEIDQDLKIVWDEMTQKWWASVRRPNESEFHKLATNELCSRLAQEIAKLKGLNLPGTGK